MFDFGFVGNCALRTPAEKHMKITDHANTRMQQRGRSEADIELIVACGTRTRDGYLLRNRDAEVAICELKSEIVRLGQLKGTVIITDRAGDQVITIYRANRRKQHKMLSRSRRGTR